MFPKRCARLRIFVSYAREDEPLAQEIAQALRGAGDQVFFDQQSLKPGEDFARRIRGAIRQSDRFVFVASAASLASESFARMELDFAKEKHGAPDGWVWPVLADNTQVEQLDPYLRAVNVIPKGAHAAQRLAAAIDDTRRVGALCWTALLAMLTLTAGLIGYALTVTSPGAPEARIDGPIRASHYLGTPSIILPMAFENGGDAQMVVERFTLTLSPGVGVGEGVAPIELFHEGVVVDLGITLVDPRLKTLVAAPGETVRFPLSFLQFDAGQAANVSRLGQRLQADPAAAAKTLAWTPQQELLTASEVSAIRGRADAVFPWAPGPWRVELRFFQDGQARLLAAQFTLTERDVAEMRAVMDSYRSGVGVLPNWRFLGPALIAWRDVENQVIEPTPAQ